MHTPQLKPEKLLLLLHRLDYIKVHNKIYFLQRVDKRDKDTLQTVMQLVALETSTHHNLNKIVFTVIQIVLSHTWIEMQEYEFNENCLVIYHLDDTTHTLMES